MAAQGMSEQLAADGHAPTGFVVQQMVTDGVEMIVGLVQDPSFGPVLACGAGGVTAELIKDVSVRLTPLSEHDPAQMVRELKTYPAALRLSGLATRATWLPSKMCCGVLARSPRICPR